MPSVIVVLVSKRSFPYMEQSLFIELRVCLVVIASLIPCHVHCTLLPGDIIGWYAVCNTSSLLQAIFRGAC